MTTSSPSRFDAFDGIRALAVLAVFASHATPKASGGWMGVEVFFVLSGYLITSLLLREHHTTGRVSFRRFYARRALRLYPALVMLLVLGLAFYRDFGVTLEAYRKTAVVSGLYLTDVFVGFGQWGVFPHTWSLAVEEQFYLLWPPLLVLLLRRRRNVGAIAIGTGFLLLAATGIFLAFGNHTVLPGSYFLPWVQAPVLLAGCALAATGWRPAKQWAPACAGMGALGLLWLTLVNQTSRGNDLAVMLLAGSAFSVALIAGLVADPRGLAARLLSFGPLAYLGRISYGFYLYHWAVLAIVGHRLATRGWSHHRIMAVELVVSLVAAIVSYHAVEQPILKLKKLFATPRPALIPVPAALVEKRRAPDRGEPATDTLRSLPAVPVVRHATASATAVRSIPVSAAPVSRRGREAGLVLAAPEESRSFE